MENFDQKLIILIINEENNSIMREIRTKIQLVAMVSTNRLNAIYAIKCEKNLSNWMTSQSDAILRSNCIMNGILGHYVMYTFVVKSNFKAYKKWRQSRLISICDEYSTEKAQIVNKLRRDKCISAWHAWWKVYVSMYACDNSELICAIPRFNGFLTNNRNSITIDILFLMCTLAHWFPTK